jgi:hypothetical protein
VLSASCSISAHSLGAGERVELVAGLGEAGCRIEVVVGAERDHERVGLVHACIGRHAPRLGVDRGDRLTQHAHARLGDLRVAHRDGVRRRAPEHHVELREAEHEPVVLVDQRHLELITAGLGQRRAELEPAESRSEHDDALAHFDPLGSRGTGPLARFLAVRLPAASAHRPALDAGRPRRQAPASGGPS